MPARNVSQRKFTLQELPHLIRENAWCIFFGTFVIIQLAILFTFNLTHLRHVAGFDSSAAMAQAMEIWNQHTIFLKDWDYQATLGLDSLILPASIFYGITKNIFLAYGLADCLGILLYLYIFKDILTELRTTRLARLIAYVILLTPYSLEPLGYMPMMFTGAAYYIIKVLIPIMLIDLMIKIRLEKPIYKYLPLLCIYLFAVYLTALSCGLYLLICGIFPIIAYTIYLRIASGNRTIIPIGQLLLLGGSLIVFALGYFTAKLYGATLFTSDMILTQVADFMNNIGKCIVGIAELFGALPSQKINVTSAFGIHYLSHMAAFLICMIIIIVTMRTAKPFSLIMKNALNGDHSYLPTPTNQVIGMVSCIIAVNLAVLILTDTTYGSESFEYRYHLIPIVAGFLIVCIGISNLISWIYANGIGNRTLARTILACIAGIWILCNAVFVYYYSLRNTLDYSEQILSYVENKTDESLVYFIGDSSSETIETGRIARLLDTNLTIVDGTAVGDFLGWGASTTHYEPVEGIDHLIIVCTPDTYSELEERYQYSMHLIQHIGPYSLYLLEDPMTAEEYEELMKDTK